MIRYGVLSISRNTCRRRASTPNISSHNFGKGRNHLPNLEMKQMVTKRSHSCMNSRFISTSAAAHSGHNKVNILPFYFHHGVAFHHLFQLKLTKKYSRHCSGPKYGIIRLFRIQNVAACMSDLQRYCLLSQFSRSMLLTIETFSGHRYSCAK